MARRDRDRVASPATAAAPSAESSPALDVLAVEPAPAEAPPLPAWPAPFRIVGPGSVLLGGLFHRPGAVVSLSEADALTFGALVEPA